MKKAYTCGIQTNIKREITVRKGEITINNINHFIYKSPFYHTYQSGSNLITTPFLPYFTYLTPMCMCVSGGSGQRAFMGPSRKNFCRGTHGREKALVTDRSWGGHSGVVCRVNKVVVGEFFG
ncbi:hypothetical protein C8R31_10484 [Nitrosospira sp. Nsp2]|nr:hypothetical protein C8R31_10484 [Nitrosospira sp. Nsp2]